MALVVAALEVSDKIQTVGAFAGFAAILGLAVMSVLYFGQARELKRLRDWAGRAPERAAEMQDRVQGDAQRRVVAQPIAQTRPPAAVPATPGAAAAAASPPGAPPAAPATPASPPGAPATPEKPADAAAAKPAEGGTDQPTVLQPSVAGTTPPAVTPATPAAPPAGGAAPTPASRPEPAVPLRSARAAREEAAAAVTETSSNSPAGATVAIVGAVAAIVVAILLVVTGVIGGGGDDPKKSNTIVDKVPTSTTDSGSTDATKTPSTTSTTSSVSAALNRAAIVVVVLNGTSTPALAANAKDSLVKDGYTKAEAGDRGDQTIAQTTIYYGGGSPTYRRAAQDIARKIGVASAQVTQLDAGTQAVAQSFSFGKVPQVVVTLGADKAQQQ